MRKIPMATYRLKPNDKLYAYSVFTYEGQFADGSTLGGSVEEVRLDLLKHQYAIQSIEETMSHAELINYIGRLTPLPFSLGDIQNKRKQKAS
jgi:hypothetical protein